jgi:hypothetical protein
VPADAPDGAQLIEAERGGSINFAVDADGSVEAAGVLTVEGSESPQVAVYSDQQTLFGPILDVASTTTGDHEVIAVQAESAPADGWGMGGYFIGGRIGAYGEVFGAGSRSYTGLSGYVSRTGGGSLGNYYGVHGHVDVDDPINSAYAIYGSASGSSSEKYAGYFSGDAHVMGTFTAGVKSFKIDHPLDPENKCLLHSCVESSDMMNVYNGNVGLDERGEAWVQMPDWFEALNQDFRYQLTAIGAPGPNLYVADMIRDNRFRIAGGEPGMLVSWMVTGVRHDPLAEASRVTVEVEKPPHQVGRYMHPEAYGKPATMGVDYRDDEGPVSRSASDAGDRSAKRDRSDGH